MKLNKKNNAYEKDYEFKNEDFFVKQNYNLNLENFRIKKINNKSNKFLFLNTSIPCVINFIHGNLKISNFNANKCKDIISLNNLENNYLFIFNNKISFGSFSNNQNQNIYTLKKGKNINKIKLIDLTEDRNNKSINNIKQKKYILTIEDTENIQNTNNTIIINSCLV